MSCDGDDEGWGWITYRLQKKVYLCDLAKGDLRHMYLISLGAWTVSTNYRVLILCIDWGLLLVYLFTKLLKRSIVRGGVTCIIHYVLLSHFSRQTWFDMGHVLLIKWNLGIWLWERRSMKNEGGGGRGHHGDDLCIVINASVLNIHTSDIHIIIIAELSS